MFTFIFPNVSHAQFTCHGAAHRPELWVWLWIRSATTSYQWQVGIVWASGYSWDAEFAKIKLLILRLNDRSNFPKVCLGVGGERAYDPVHGLMLQLSFITDEIQITFSRKNKSNEEIQIYKKKKKYDIDHIHNP